MNHLELLAQQYRFNAIAMKMTCKGFDDEDWFYHPTDGGSPAIWILGHITSSRCSIVRMLTGEGEKAAWEANFPRGSHPSEDRSGYPTPEELKSIFDEKGQIIIETLTNLSPEDAARKLEFKFPNGADTLDAALYFLFFHESYHIGQMGMLRRMRGKEGIAG